MKLVGLNKTRLYFERFSLHNLAGIFGIASAGSAISLFLNVMTGLLIVRYLNTDDYALYTIALAAYQTINNLGDQGVTSAVTNEARSDWTSVGHMGTSLSSGRRVRRRIYPMVVIASAFFLYFMLSRHGKDDTLLLPNIALILIASVATMETGLLNVPLYLHQKITCVQAGQLGSDVIRFITILSLGYLFPNPTLFLLILVASILLQRSILSRGASPLYDKKAKSSPEATRNIIQFVKKISPVCIYSCISGYLTVWLATLFGGTKDVASIGGLSRIAALLTVLNVTYSMVIVPRYSRINASENLKKKYWISFSFLFVLVTAAIAPIMLFPRYPLLLLGESYSNLETELRITCLGGATGVIYYGIYALAMARGGLANPLVYLISSVAWQVILFMIFDISSIRGILWIGAFSSIPGIICYTASAIKGINNERANFG